MLEKDFQNDLIELAAYAGWLRHHTRPAQNQNGRWLTPIQGDAGYPDLTLCHPKWGKLITAELKTDRGKPTENQKIWLAGLDNVTEYRNYLWQPKHYDTIEKVLLNK